MPAILVYSRAGENLIEGQRKKLIVGNTRVLAEKIAEKIQCPLYSLEPAYPYPESYQAMVELAKKKKRPMNSLSIKRYRQRFLKNGSCLSVFPIGGAHTR